MKPDRMRTFAWILLVVGILVALGAPLWIAAEERRLEAATHRAALRSAWGYSDGYYWGLRRELEALSAWPIVGVGAGLATLGLLLLAIRRPEKRDVAT